MNQTTPETLVQSVVEWALEKKAEDVQVLDLSGGGESTACPEANGNSWIQVTAGDVSYGISHGKHGKTKGQ